ncbi:hypothetical protein [Thioclava indica]|nr:hypothetical protein [Thioclava indica]
MNRSKNAHSSSDIRSRAKLIFFADTSLNHDQAAVGIPFVDRTGVVVQINVGADDPLSRYFSGDGLDLGPAEGCVDGVDATYLIARDTLTAA